MVTLDGFFEGPNKELDWLIVDEEFNVYAKDLLTDVDALLFGRLSNTPLPRPRRHYNQYVFSMTACTLLSAMIFWAAFAQGILDSLYPKEAINLWITCSNMNQFIKVTHH